MSAFRQAIRAEFEPKLACPRCDAMNRPGAPPDVPLDVEQMTAVCTHCGYGGPVDRFQRKEPR